MILKGIVRLVWDDSHNSARSIGHSGLFHFASPIIILLSGNALSRPKMFARTWQTVCKNKPQKHEAGGSCDESEVYADDG